MDTISIDKKDLLEYHKKADTKGKKLLELIHGKELFEAPAALLTEWDDIAKFKKLHPVKSLPFQKPKNAIEKRTNIHFRMEHMVEYWNTDQVTKKVWEPRRGDWGYRVWYEDKPGVGFVFYDSYYDYVISALGSRLHLKDAPTAKIAAVSLQKMQNGLFKTSK